ncbi:nuclear transport factor 2 family protein [Streptomyces sp. 184]|uniref:nuclear transport factor 2 family protein n=1 Tax=Streptomyces sp. 184 TaxID=1827526 RepID=UPI003891A625
MTSTENESFAPGTPLVDALVVGGLLDRYLIGLDTEKLDDRWARGLFTEDAAVVFPMSGHRGIEGLAEWHRTSLAAFARTQHLNSPAVVECTGDTAALRANLVSTHVHRSDDARPGLFAVGTSVTGEARRTAAGWRLSALTFGVIWMDGSPPGAGG